MYALGIEIPERNKLRFMEKVPMYPAGLRPPKMQKNLRFMRGPEEIHTELTLRQYGIIVSHPVLGKEKLREFV